MPITFSGRLLLSAIFAIGSADVFDANMQCSGMCCTVTKQTQLTTENTVLHYALSGSMKWICPTLTWHIYGVQVDIFSNTISYR